MDATEGKLKTATRERIITAAIDIFAEKGKHGARMEEIAERGEVNKAMLYYYYSSRDNLYREVLRRIIRHNFGLILRAIKGTGDVSEDPIEQVKFIARTHFRVFSSNPAYTKVLLEAVADEPNEVREILSSLKEETDIKIPDRALEIFEKGTERGIFRDVDPRQVMISIIGMNLIHFLARPIAEVILGLEMGDEEVFLKKREESVLDLLLHGIVRSEGNPHESKLGGHVEKSGHEIPNDIPNREMEP